VGSTPYAAPHLSGSAWWTDALCGIEQSEGFFPDERGRHSEVPRATEAAAKAICERCPVREPCLQAALRNREPVGIWGGLTTSERQRLLTDPARRLSAS
jgi:WhiB family redox-sensing transcriptional regulator